MRRRAADLLHVGRAELDPLFDLARVVDRPKGGFAFGGEPAPEGKPLARVHREGEDAQHQALFGFRRVPRHREGKGPVEISVEVRKVENRLVDRCAERHAELPRAALIAKARSIRLQRASGAVSPMASARQPVMSFQANQIMKVKPATQRRPTPMGPRKMSGKLRMKTARMKRIARQKSRI